MRLKIDEICDLNKNSLTSKDVLDSIEYLDTSSITENTISCIQKLDYKDAPSRAKRKVKDNTIVYSTVRPNLKHFGILNNPQNNFIVSTGFTTIDVKKEFQGRINPYYVYLLLSNQIIVDYLAQVADVAVSSYPSINPSDIGNLVFDFPDIVVQDRIVSQIKPINKKIALNTRMNAELEAMAKQLCDYWFVQFDFPDENGKPYKSSGGKMLWNEKLKREIPEGWEVKNVFDVFNVLYGFPFSTNCFVDKITDKPVVRIRDIMDNTTSAYTTEDVDEIYRLEEGDLVIGMDGNFHMNFWHNNSCFLNQRSVRFRGITDFPLSTFQLYYNIKPILEHKQKSIKGSTVGHLLDSDIKDFWILCSTANYRKEIKQRFDSLLYILTKNKKEKIALTHLRDTLLPMLMNGQVGVIE